MKNLARNSKFNINVNFEKSHGLYLFDNKTQKEYLDFFGMYASLPLGYNHEIFKSESFKKEVLSASNVKIANCEFVSDESMGFDKKFTQYANRSGFSNFHYTCTGALAVEAAIKTCIHNSGYKTPNIISFKNSFHGINSLSSFITDRFWPATTKLDNFPEIFSTKIDLNLSDLESALSEKFVTCVIVEPIQCSAGDIYQDLSFFKGVRDLCDMYEVPLIFDEIQVGFGGTGKLWFYEHTDIVPDILVYGKKTQLSGIMVMPKYSKIFEPESVTRLEVTWDGDLMDMIRCKYIIDAYQKYNILENVQIQSKNLLNTLRCYEELKNPRSCGLIAAFDLEDREQRDSLVQELYNNGMLVNKTGKRSVRLRPPLSLNNDDICSADEIIKKSLKNIKKRG